MGSYNNSCGLSNYPPPTSTSISMSGIGGRVPELLNLHANLSTGQVMTACHQRRSPYLDMPWIILTLIRGSAFCVVFFFFFFYPHNCCVHMLGADCMC